MTRGRRVAALVAAGIVAASLPAAAYLKLGTRAGTRTVTLRWNEFPIRYFVTNRDGGGVTASQFQGAVTRAFATWHAVPDTRTSSEFAGFTSSGPVSGDGATVIGFEARPDLDRTLAATNFFIDTTNGEILESDIFFNSDFPWSTATAGEANRFDVESIAVHELGHLLGLSHSALGETELRAGGRRVLGAGAVMFPIAFSAGDISDRTLRADDIAGISDIYGTAAFQRATGSVSGRVTKNGQGVLGAHIVAFNPRTGKLVGGFSLSDDGTFVIAGLEPGPQVLRAEPLDDADIDGFFDDSFDVDIDFKVTFHDRLVVIPRGGGARNVEIKVSPK
jgi:Matrixin